MANNSSQFTMAARTSNESSSYSGQQMGQTVLAANDLQQQMADEAQMVSQFYSQSNKLLRNVQFGF